jgi:hypothetical protein
MTFSYSFSDGPELFSTMDMPLYIYIWGVTKHIHCGWARTTQRDGIDDARVWFGTPREMTRGTGCARAKYIYIYIYMYIYIAKQRVRLVPTFIKAGTRSISSFCFRGGIASTRLRAQGHVGLLWRLDGWDTRAHDQSDRRLLQHM